MTPFSAEEAFRVAYLIERNGAAFYRRAAQNVTDEECRKLMLELVKMEDQHAETFTAMYEKLTRRTFAEALDDDDALRTMADGYVFGIKSGPGDILSGNASLEDILKTALKTEKDSVIFYMWMQRWVDGEGQRRQVDSIIAEEMQHVVDISGQLTQLRESATH